jgi:hypothetical protein
LRFASLSLLKRDYSRADLTAIRKPLDFPERHGFDISGLKSTLAKMSGMRVLVVGDLIVDEYAMKCTKSVEHGVPGSFQTPGQCVARHLANGSNRRSQRAQLGSVAAQTIHLVSRSISITFVIASKICSDPGNHSLSLQSIAAWMANTGAASLGVRHRDLEQPACIAEGKLLAIRVRQLRLGHKAYRIFIPHIKRII